MKTLTEIANHYGTDKGTGGTHHGYTNYYEHWCAPRRRQRLSILEIGVLDGASLRMWAEYFQCADVYGIDINPVPPSHDGRITVCMFDQTDVPRLTQFGQMYGPFDLIIDDAGHEDEPQVVSLEALLPFLAPGGRYCIEDVLAEQPIMNLTRREWSGLARPTQALAGTMTWSAKPSLYPGRYVMMGDKQ